MMTHDVPAAVAQTPLDYTREKRIAKLVLLGMALAVIVLLTSPLARTLFSIGSALVLVTWIDYLMRERGKSINVWMKAGIAIIGFIMAYIYLRIMAQILLQIMGSWGGNR
jgi:hypothetical protein